MSAVDPFGNPIQPKGAVAKRRPDNRHADIMEDLRLAEGGEAHVKTKDAPEERKALIEFDVAKNVWGSTAGAGSDYFHLYKRERDREIARLEKMDKDWDEKEAHLEFQKKRAEGLDKAAAKTAKNREKRQRKKMNADARKKQKTDTDETNGFNNDGSFLEEAKRLLEEEEKAKKDQALPSVKQMNYENITIRDDDIDF